MEAPDSRIGRFIRRHHVLTLATRGADGELWCSNLFYAYHENESGKPFFIFTSGEETLHARHFQENPEVAGSVVLESRVIGKLQGLQFQGKVRRAGAKDQVKALYLKRFPYARVMLKELWILEPTRMKYTDNRLGFGTKLHWAPEEKSQNL